MSALIDIPVKDEYFAYAAKHSWASTFAKDNKADYAKDDNWERMFEDGYSNNEFMERDIMSTVAELLTCDLFGVDHEPSDSPRSWDVRVGDKYYSVKSMYDSTINPPAIIRRKNYIGYAKKDFNYEYLLRKKSGKSPCANTFFWEIQKDIGGYTHKGLLWGIPDTFAEIWGNDGRNTMYEQFQYASGIPLKTFEQRIINGELNELEKVYAGNS